MQKHIAQLYKHECQNCHKVISAKQQNVHHISYENVGKENDEDLTLLCRKCHEQIHGIEPKPKKEKTKKKKKKSKYKHSKESVLQLTIRRLDELSESDRRDILIILMRKYK